MLHTTQFCVLDFYFVDFLFFVATFICTDSYIEGLVQNVTGVEIYNVHVGKTKVNL